MRTINDHVVPGDAALQVEIQVLDEPGQGGACHDYKISGTFPKGSPSPIRSHFKISGTFPKGSPSPIQSHIGDAVIEIDSDGSTTITLCHIKFQNGPIKEVGVNGIPDAVLAVILMDRLRSFQAGEFSCRENAIALTHFEEGLMWLQKRTVDRLRRGVEGTAQK